MINFSFVRTPRSTNCCETVSMKHKDISSILSIQNALSPHPLNPHIKITPTAYLLSYKLTTTAILSLRHGWRGSGCSSTPNAPNIGKCTAIDGFEMRKIENGPHPSSIITYTITPSAQQWSRKINKLENPRKRVIFLAQCKWATWFFMAKCKKVQHQR